MIRKHGVGRISINPQTMQQKTLDVIGRRHTVEDVVRIFHLARELGFDNINMDLIAGLPGEHPEEMEDTLRQIKELAPDSLTVHALCNETWFETDTRTGCKRRKTKLQTDGKRAGRDDRYGT